MRRSPAQKITGKNHKTADQNGNFNPKNEGGELK
jgi:hypothetical protein